MDSLVGCRSFCTQLEENENGNFWFYQHLSSLKKLAMEKSRFLMKMFTSETLKGAQEEQVLKTKGQEIYCISHQVKQDIKQTNRRKFHFSSHNNCFPSYCY